jgi:hypothetical protein
LVQDRTRPLAVFVLRHFGRHVRRWNRRGQSRRY